MRQHLSQLPINNYREMLSQELRRRKQRNLAYSLRSFARDLGLSASKLSEALNGKKPISIKKAQIVLKSVNWSQTEKEFFLDSLTSLHSKSAQDRREAKKRLQIKIEELSLERFSTISDWHHMAFLESLETESPPRTAKDFAVRFGISLKLAAQSVQRLIALGLIVREAPDGRLHQTFTELATPTDLASSALCEHHSQILAKATQALETIPIEKRDFSCVHMAIAESDLIQAKAMIRDFRKAFNARFSKTKKRERVYCLSLQFFPTDLLHNHKK